MPEIGAFSDHKPGVSGKQPNGNKVGPLVQMLKELDERGLLQECMQHYIDIQGQYDNLNQQEA